ncbi:uncharacterized protein BX664DRAFT_332044 [Halteromyces radiatus]|uniref:uncharacterized protein n=1 Tax=Halteromyces radiatus TaxID=101107 RepID=UPI00221FC12F|nr:uncharacterized protein BX664DRAFT_332044 [Halteromyces radiatus]KAI8089046.1 hypothetical protein BX664DRAFT_332044 [Halteromyces radiatus]
MDAIINIDNAIKLLNYTYQLTLQLIDDWQSVGPEGKTLLKECELFEVIIKDVKNKPHLPITEILASVDKTLNSTNDMITQFLERDKKQRASTFGTITWKVKRVYLAHDYRATFKSTSAHLEASKKKIEDTLRLSAIVSKPTIHWYRDDMPNHESFLFWKEMCGEDLQAKEGNTWDLFVKNYQMKYGVDWNDDITERIRRVACSGGGSGLTIAGYICLIKLCDFPLNLEKLPTLMDSHATVSAQTRMEVAKMVNELITYYSTREMRDLIVAIFTWFKDTDKHDKVAWQERANEWARQLMNNRGKKYDELDEEGRLVEQVDMARRTYSFFFQRYMVVFKIGQLSKEMFAEVDFPGKARMYEFINYVRPLDHANYHIVIHGDPSEWIAKQPKVYTFLEDFIATEKRAKRLAKEKALKAAANQSSRQENDLSNVVASVAVTNPSSHDAKVEISSTDI